MKVEQLIAELQKLPQGIEVCIGDYKKNCALAVNDEPCGEGIYPNFKVEVMHTEVRPEESPIWASLTFDSKYGED